MSDSIYPRPHVPPLPARRNPNGGVAAVVLTLPALLNALEVLMVGEELSPLGERVQAISRAGSLDWYSFGLKVGGVVLLLAASRIAAGIAMARGRRWGTSLLLALSVPSLAADAACFSSPLVVVWLALDFALLVAVVRSLRR